LERVNIVNDSEGVLKHAQLVLFALLLASAPAQAAPLESAVVGMLESLSLPVPDPPNVLICHGFGCNFRTAVGFETGDRARLAGLMVGGRASPAAERKGIGAAYAWFEKRVASAAGTGKAIARTTPRYMRDPAHSTASTRPTTPPNCSPCWRTTACCTTTSSTCRSLAGW